eukprot:scaffold4105_cov47-Attheya_sp.AAC.1
MQDKHLGNIQDDLEQEFLQNTPHHIHGKAYLYRLWTHFLDKKMVYEDGWRYNAQSVSMLEMIPPWERH